MRYCEVCGELGDCIPVSEDGILMSWACKDCVHNEPSDEGEYVLDDEGKMRRVG